jgi:hypothetical protein
MHEISGFLIVLDAADGEELPFFARVNVTEVGVRCSDVGLT